MSLRLAGLFAPAALLFAVSTAPAQHGGGHGGGGHGGGGHMGGAHFGGAHMGGAHFGGAHIGGAHFGGVHHIGGAPIGGFRHGGHIVGFRGGYFGGYGFPYLGYGYGYPYGLGGYGLGGYGYGLGGYGYGLGGYGYGLGSGYYGNYGYPYQYDGYGDTYLNGGYNYVSPASAVVGAASVMSSLYTTPSTGGTYAQATQPSEPAPATVTVQVPADAQLWFGGEEDKTGGTTRVFKSAPLQPGQDYVLPIKARWGGSTREMQIPVRAGDKLTVDLTQL